MGTDNNDLGDLSALSGDGFPGDDLPTEDELAEHGKEALWLSDEAAPGKCRVLLRRIDAALGEILEISEAVSFCARTDSRRPGSCFVRPSQS